MRSDRWTAVPIEGSAGSPRGGHRAMHHGGAGYAPQNSYSTVLDSKYHPDYEDPEYYYERPPEPPIGTLNRLSH
ncbi:hypothetical protein AAVH_37270, partial [Aphelenchoides avenae]